MHDPKWPSAAVAIGLLAMIAAVAVAAILNYAVDDALKVWTALASLVGVVTGAFVAYFFTRGTVQQAEQSVATAKESAEGLRDTVTRLQEEMKAQRQEATRFIQIAQENQVAISKIMASLSQRQAEALLADPAIASALEPPTAPPST